MKLRLGLVVNPYAGLGGPRAQKGSDSQNLAQQALLEQWPLSSPERVIQFIAGLALDGHHWVCAPGIMGADYVKNSGANYEVVGDDPPPAPKKLTSKKDTQNYTKAIVGVGVDLLIFVGGDGTARDVHDVLPKGQLALGVPAGVKMQSGVYAITPNAAAKVCAQLACGDLVKASLQEVRDIDEASLQKGVIKSRHHGEMLTPQSPEFVQQVKQGGLEVEALVILDMAEHLSETLPSNALLIFGPGSTTDQILKCWQLQGTLLGVDVVRAGAVIAADVTANRLEQLVVEATVPVFIVVTAIGGQGHIIGRGNQQITPKILRQVGRQHLRIVCTKTKLNTLEGRPLLIDSGDAVLDEMWQGLMPVITGYQDKVLVHLGGVSQNMSSQC